MIISNNEIIVTDDGWWILVAVHEFHLHDSAETPRAWDDNSHPESLFVFCCLASFSGKWCWRWEVGRIYRPDDSKNTWRDANTVSKRPCRHKQILPARWQKQYRRVSQCRHHRVTSFTDCSCCPPEQRQQMAEGRWKWWHYSTRVVSHAHLAAKLHSQE